MRIKETTEMTIYFKRLQKIKNRFLLNKTSQAQWTLIKVSEHSFPAGFSKWRY